MHAKLFVELGVEVGSRLALISTQLNSSLTATAASLCIAGQATVFNAHARLSHCFLFLSLMAHLD
jgi:hypothetical protein